MLTETRLRSFVLHTLNLKPRGPERTFASAAPADEGKLQNLKIFEKKFPRFIEFSANKH